MHIMQYGIIKQLLIHKNDSERILIENAFNETTRYGKQIRYVQLALTPTTFIIGHEAIIQCISSKHCHRDDNPHELLSFYPLKSIKITIFKKSRRNSLKVCYKGLVTRYFELESNCKKRTFWNIWTIYVSELKNKETKIWPFIGPPSNVINRRSVSTNQEVSMQFKQCRLRWIDKYLYLGEKREIEDQLRPIPVAGLGSTEFIKLLNLKPQYFGCWAQSDHWVQCE